MDRQAEPNTDRYQKSMSAINSGDFWQCPDAGHLSLLHIVELHAPCGLARCCVYSHTPQTKQYVMTPVHVTRREGVEREN